MDYNQISSFLDKFKKLIFQKEESKIIVLKVIIEEVKHNIPKECLKIKDGIILITGSPMLKNEIFMHKTQILNKLKSFLPDSYFIDIK